ncbi:hypothetical protein [Alloprevotella tannerae]|uniref:hypothetical protein n=1 Tax=Alloprevotella tannerae TaxID=76122 RepID=UPI0028D7346A|nr:hypothetical protein [Alloprevotella tannerae]
MREICEDGQRHRHRPIPHSVRRPSKSALSGVLNACSGKPHSIVWWQQTIVCRQHTIVWPEQTIVWWQQTNKRRQIGTQLSVVFCSFTMNSYAYCQR